MSKNSFTLIIVLGGLFLVVLGVGLIRYLGRGREEQAPPVRPVELVEKVVEPEEFKKDEEKDEKGERGIELRLVKKTKIADGMYPGIVYEGGNFFVAYGGWEKPVVVDVYDKDFRWIGKRFELEGTRFDFQLVFSGEYFYLVGPHEIIQYDLEFRQVKSVSSY